jgi:hypothetical protein
VLLLDLRDVRITVRQPDGEVFAKSIRRVVPAVERDWFDRQRSPLRKLRVDESSHDLEWNTSQHDADVDSQRSIGRLEL